VPAPNIIRSISKLPLGNKEIKAVRVMEKEGMM
jgi:hypothetical protein